jgi:hypothetical protein
MSKNPFVILKDVMLNLQPNSVNNLIIYADTVNDSIGNFFTIIFTNTYSKQTFAVVPTVVRRNSRFVELEVETVGVNGLNQPLDGQIYLYPDGNFTYQVFHTNAPTLTLESPLSCAVWNTEDDFWNFAYTVWNVCEIDYNIIDRGQAFLYADTDACEREIEFVPYTSGNNILDAVVYVTNVPLYQFPCTIPAPEDYVVEIDTTTYCQTIVIENGASLTVSGTAVLTQTAAPYGYC